MSVSIVRGVTPSGKVITLLLNEDGSLAGTGSSTPTGAATEATLGEVRDRLPYSNDSDVSAISVSTNPVAILATNLARQGATFYNDSTAILYLKLGTGAASNSFTTKLLQDDYYELPAGYVGVVSGVWDSSPTPTAQVSQKVYVTELTNAIN